MCLSVTLHIVEPWQYYVCCTRAGVARCTLYMVLYLLYLYLVLYLVHLTYVPLRITRGTSVAHQYAYARAYAYHITFILLSESLWNDLCDPL